MSENNENKENMAAGQNWYPDPIDEPPGTRFNERRVRAVLDSLPFVTMELDRDLNVLWANRATLLLSPDPVGCRCYEVIRGRSEVCEKCPCVKTIKTGSVHVDVVEIEDEKGDTHYWEEFSVPILDKQLNPGGVFVVARNITWQRIAEYELTRSNEQFRFLIENQADFVVRMDPERKLVFASPSFSEFVGRPGGELEGVDFFDFVSEDDRQQVSDVFQSILNKPRTLAFRHRMTVGVNLHWLSWTLKVVHDADSKISSIIGVGRDVTTHKKQEDLILQSRQKLAFHVQRTPLAYIEWNSDFEVVDWNPSAERIFGYSYHEVVGKSVIDVLVARECREEFSLMINALMDRSGGARAAVTNLTKDGRRIQCEWYNTSLVSGTNRVGGIASLVEDVTERIETEQALKDSEEKFKLLADNIKEVFWLRTLTEVIYESSAFTEIWGVPAETMYENPFAHIESIIPEDREKYLEMLKSDSFMSEGTFDIEYRIKRTDGEIRWVRDRGWPIKNEKGDIYRLAGLAEDVTEKKKAEEETRKLQQQLIQAQKMESVGQLAGGVAHEFNNMLAVIMGNVNLALEKLKNEDEVADELNNIMEASKQAHDISTQLLSFARRTHPEMKQVYIDNLVINLMKMVTRTFPDNIAIRLKTQKAPVSVNVDQNQVTQALVNICNNARDAMSEGGILTIKTLQKKLGPAFCKSRSGLSPGKYCMIIFSDTGPGISKENRNKILEPFFTTKEVGKGTGLGLSVATGIIQNHGGYIEIGGMDGKGAKVTVYLPVAE